MNNICILGYDTKHSIDRTVLLAKKNYNITFILSRYFPYVENIIKYKNVDIKFIDQEVFERQKTSLMTVYQLLNEVSPDAIIIHYCSYVNFHAAIFSGFKPIIGTVMGAEIDIIDSKVPLHVKLEMSFTKLYLPYIELLVAKTNRIKKLCEDNSLEGEVMTIPWGINTSSYEKNKLRYEKDAIRKNLLLPASSWLILSCRAVVRESNIIDIIKGFHSFLNKGDDARLIIINYYFDKEYLFEINHIVKELNLEDKIIFRSSVTPDELDLMYLACDLLICNRTFDGFPQTFFEAGINGLPILTSKLEAYNDILKDNRDVIYHNGTPKNISHKISMIYNDKDMYAELSRNIKHTVKQNGNLEKWSNIFLDKFENIIKKEKVIQIPLYKKFIGYILFILIFISRKSFFKKIMLKVSQS